MKKLCMLAIVFACLVPAAFAAGGKEAPKAEAKEAPKAAVDTSTPVKVVMLPPNRITPGFLSGGPDAIFASCVYDWLFRLNGQTGKVEPSLVESYETSADAKTWTMKLRKGVKFHHGADFSADDVVFTVNRWLNKDLGIGLYGVFSNLIQKVEKVDTNTVRFILTKADTDFHLKFLDYNTAMLCKDYDYDKLGETKPSGTGAFMVDTLTARERATLKANPNYFISGVPYIDKMELLFIQERETQVKMLESGQADLVADITVDQYNRLNSNSNTVGMFVELGHHVVMSMRTDVAPFNDKRVRQAMKLVVDRQKMLDTVMYGKGVLGNDTPIAPFNPYYDDLGGIKKRDVAKAKALLAEAGHKDGLDVTIYTSSNTPPELDVAIAYQQMAKDGGINVEISTATSDVYYAKYWLKEKFTATLWGHREDISQLLALAYTSNSPWNEGHYKNPEFDQYVELANSSTDLAKKKEYFKKIQEILSDDGPGIISFFQPYFGGTSKRVKDFYLTRNWINDYRYIKFNN